MDKIAEWYKIKKHLDRACKDRDQANDQVALIAGKIETLEREILKAIPNDAPRKFFQVDENPYIVVVEGGKIFTELAVQVKEGTALLIKQ